jgi:restriction system protein
MSTYSDIQLYSIAILLFFFLWFLGWLFVWMRRDRYLCRYRSLKRLKRAEWDTFEHLCAHLFRKEGWQVEENSHYGADGGIDLRLRKRRRYVLVQCKKYEDAKVGIKVVREMYGLMHEHEADAVMIVTTSTFTKECYRFAEEKPVVLITGEEIVTRIKKRC